MTRRRDWVLLAYRLPRQPSAPRLAVWRKLKRLGVAQLLDGLVGLPLDSRNREQLEWIADQVVEAGGGGRRGAGAGAGRGREQSRRRAETKRKRRDRESQKARVRKIYYPY